LGTACIFGNTAEDGNVVIDDLSYETEYRACRIKKKNANY